MADETERETTERRLRETEAEVAEQIELIGQLITKRMSYDGALRTLQLTRQLLKVLQDHLERFRRENAES